MQMKKSSCGVTEWHFLMRKSSGRQNVLYGKCIGIENGLQYDIPLPSEKMTTQNVCNFM